MRALEWRAWASLAAALVPVGVVLLWLKPLVDETLSHDPGPGERCAAIQQYGSQLVVSNDQHFRLAAEVFGRSGAVAVAALFLLPVTGARAPTAAGRAFIARRLADRARS